MSSSSNETNFNNLKEATPNRKKTAIAFFWVAVTIIIAFVIWLFLAMLTKEYASTYTAAELIAIITLFLAITKFTWDICKRILHSVNASKKNITLRVDSEQGYTTITCRISNQDSRRIRPKDIYLFVEKGLPPKEGDCLFRFPFLLCHRMRDSKQEADCQLGAICKIGNLQAFPDYILPEEFQAPTCDKIKVIRLDELCQEGRHYIDPGEEFAQDVVLRFSAEGVYRATVIWTSEDNDDCICASKVFVVIPNQA